MGMTSKTIIKIMHPDGIGFDFHPIDGDSSFSVLANAGGLPVIRVHKKGDFRGMPDISITGDLYVLNEHGEHLSFARYAELSTKVKARPSFPRGIGADQPTPERYTPNHPEYGKILGGQIQGTESKQFFNPESHDTNTRLPLEEAYPKEALELYSAVLGWLPENYQVLALATIASTAADHPDSRIELAVENGVAGGSPHTLYILADNQFVASFDINHQGTYARNIPHTQTANITRAMGVAKAQDCPKTIWYTVGKNDKGLCFVK